MEETVEHRFPRLEGDYNRHLDLTRHARTSDAERWAFRKDLHRILPEAEQVFFNAPLVVADDSARADLVAADMLSQAEHDGLAAAVCLTPRARLAAAVAAELGRQLASLPRRRIAAQALKNFGAVVVTRSLHEAIDISNRIAPEHLELAVRHPWRWVSAVRHAGAIFAGHSTPEALGDYLAGPNHVLPTGGTARFSSPLGVYDFVKRTNVIAGTPRALARLGPAVERLAVLEGLTAHGLAVRRRLGASPVAAGTRTGGAVRGAVR